MIWVVFAVVGVPLLLCGFAILTVVLRNRGFRTRPGGLPVRIRRPGEARWVRGHGVWIHDVFAFRGSPAAWKEELIRVSELSLRGDEPVIAALTPAEAADATIEVAARGEHRDLLSGPFLTLGAELKGHPSP